MEDCPCGKELDGVEDMRVSVIIPVYNAAKYLRQCLNSVCSQTYSDMEIVCVNNGSTDESLQILTEYSEKDNRIKVVNEEHSNAGTARNTGMCVAKGEYYLFLDADDFFDPVMVERLVECAKFSHADVIVFGGHRFDTRTGRIINVEYIHENYISSKCEYTPHELEECIFNFHTTYVWNKFFKASFIRETGIRFMECKRTNDMYFSFIALALAQKIYVLRQKFVYYRVNNEKSLQGTNDDSPLDFYRAHVAVKEELAALNLYERYRRSFLNQFAGSCLYNLRSIVNQQAYCQVYDYIKKSELLHELFENEHHMYYEKDNLIFKIKEMDALEFRELLHN